MHCRRSGIFLHLGYVNRLRETVPFEYDFIDYLRYSHQTVWQHLPINPPGKYNSPYSALSSFAGDTNLLSKNISINFDEIEYKDWLNKNSDWNYDWAIYRCLKEKFKDKEWYLWPDNYKFREKNTLSSLREKKRNKINEILHEQFLFDKKWAAIKKKCNDSNILLSGDIPFFVAFDSVDVWSNPHLFDLDEHFYPRNIAGVPPDYFSKKGQVWENPLYLWRNHKKDNFKWWKKRIEINKKKFDLLRIDHFRALVSNWAIPYGAKVAIDGYWRKGPGEKLLNIILDAFPFNNVIAEDLGLITPTVRKLVKNHRLKGMKILQFGYNSRLPNEHHHTNIPEGCICYIGTHDNNTVKGWFKEKLKERNKSSFSNLVENFKLNEENVCKNMINLAMNTKAVMCILTIQDLLGMDEKGRINVPGQNIGNWNLSLSREEINNIDWKYLKELTVATNRVNNISK